MSSIKDLMNSLGISRNIALKIDKGMWDILIELNNKGYKTVCCCEGHTDRDRRWCSYILFARGHVPKTMPPLFHIMEKGERKGIKKYSEVTKKAFYWYGTNSKRYTTEMLEAERHEMLNDVLEWAKGLEPWSCGKATV